MGDMADYLLMSQDSWDSELGDYLPPRDNTNRRCSYCGQRHLQWAMTAKGWRLRTRTGTIHSCSKYKREVE